MVCKYRTFFQRNYILRKKNSFFSQKNSFHAPKRSERKHFIRFKPSDATVGDSDLVPAV